MELSWFSRRVSRASASVLSSSAAGMGMSMVKVLDGPAGGGGLGADSALFIYETINPHGHLSTELDL